MRRCLAVFPNDPLRCYLEKGEIKPRYFNPENLFSEVHVLSPAAEDVAAEDVAPLAGDGRLLIHNWGPLTPANFCAAFARANRLLAAIKPAAVRAYNPRQSGAPAVYAAHRQGVPAVVSCHTDLAAERRMAGDWKRWLSWFLEAYTLRHADCCIAVSEHVAAYLRRRGGRQVETIYNRVYASCIAARPALDAPPRHLLSVGRLDPPKRQDIILRALAPLPHLRLRLVGQGKHRVALEKLARELGIADRVEFIPSMPYRDIFAVYGAADIFLMATEYEGFCIPVLEAMAAGVPCIVCDTPPLPEVLGGCGEVVANTPAAFTAALQRLCADRELWRRYAAAGRTRALSLDGVIMEKKEAELYRRLIGD